MKKFLVALLMAAMTMTAVTMRERKHFFTGWFIRTGRIIIRTGGICDGAVGRGTGYYAEGMVSPESGGYGNHGKAAGCFCGGASGV